MQLALDLWDLLEGKSRAAAGSRLARWPATATTCLGEEE
jgi:hypothetical protein